MLDGTDKIIIPLLYVLERKTLTRTMHVTLFFLYSYTIQLHIQLVIRACNDDDRGDREKKKKRTHNSVTDAAFIIYLFHFHHVLLSKLTNNT